MKEPGEDSPSLVPATTPCYGCRYNLVGLSIHSVCPECGLAISASWPRRSAGSEERRQAERARGRIRLVLAAAIMLLVANASLVLSACGAIVNAAGQHAQTTFKDGEGAITLGIVLAFLAVLAYAVLVAVLAAMPRLVGERRRPSVRIGGPLTAVGLIAIFPGGMMAASFPLMGGLLATLIGNAVCAVAMLGICGDVLARVDRSRPPLWLVAALAAVFAVLPVAATFSANGTVAGAGVALGAVVVMAGASALLVWQAIRGIRAVEFEARRPGQPAAG